MLAPLMFALLAGVGAGAKVAPPRRITVLYDNTTAVAGTRADWGFACLVEASGSRVLFDTGREASVLAHNLRALDVDLTGIRAVVISHVHSDHTGGLLSVVSTVPGVAVYVPDDLPDSLRREVEAAGGRVVNATAPTQVAEGVWTTGRVEGAIPEQALVVEADRGPVVVTGCAHPGVGAMVRAAAGAVDATPYMVLGGFHLVSATPGQIRGAIADLETLGIRRAAPGHCTGEEAIALFHVAFGDRSTPLGVGRVLRLGE